MRPSRPEPAIEAGSRSCSSTSLRTAGPILFADADERGCTAGASAGVRDAAAAGADVRGASVVASVVAAAADLSFAAGAAAAATAPGSRVASQLAARHDGAVVGHDLSDDPVRGRRHLEDDLVGLEVHEVLVAGVRPLPAFLCHATSVASATDSGNCGTLTSMLTGVLPQASRFRADAMRVYRPWKGSRLVPSTMMSTPPKPTIAAGERAARGCRMPGAAAPGRPA